MASFNELMSRISKGAGEIADDIIKSDTFKAIIPGKEGFHKEVAEAINSNEKIKASLKTKSIEEKIASGIQKNAFGVDISEDTAKQIAHTGKGKISDKAFENINKSLQSNGFTEEQAEKLTKFSRKNAEKVMAESIDIESLDGLDKLSVHPKTYFSNPDKKIRNTRIAATAGTYAGVTIGARYLSGGTLTTDQYGQKDIAGVPFI